MDSTFISGTEYRLCDLFGGDTKIVIPDLQRDYCWGDKAYSPSKEEKPRELVTDFVKNLFEIYKGKGKMRTTLGLIYGYEQPHSHTQICDGQQRLTTLFLLLGYLNMHSANSKFRDYIISEAEMNDDFEPHLQYAIRESTLYFLSDLSREVFINQTTGIDGIKQSNWYFNEYDQDASIQSMIAALTKIDTYFKTLNSDQSFDWEEFGDFILGNLYFLYYDMENRSRGEETYVVINTTGEPLSPTENIKPLLLGSTNLSTEDVKTYSDQWEEREEWFWKNRGEDKIADKGMLEFFVWYWQIGLMQESSWINDRKYPLNPRELFLSAPRRAKNADNSHELNFREDNYKQFQSLNNLHTYFNALKLLVEKINGSEPLKTLLLSIKRTQGQPATMTSTQEIWTWLRHADLDLVLPLIAFVAVKGTEQLYPFARRLRKNHYDGLWSKNGSVQSRRGGNYVDWRYLIQIINQSAGADVLTADTGSMNLVSIPNVTMPRWYNDDEQVKAKLREDGLDVDAMEDNEYLQGDLTPLWKFSADNTVSIEVVKRRWKMLNRILDALNSEKAGHDILFSNWFRLYRLVTGVIGIYHISNCSWEFEGVHYSYKPDTPWWIETKEIVDVLDSEDPIALFKNRVRETTGQYLRQPGDHKELVISWMTIKTIRAEAGDYLLNHRSDRAISAFKDLQKNYIIPADDFHWGNVLCGYSYSYSVFPARQETDWNIQGNLDSPLYALNFIPDFFNRSHDVIDSDTICQGDREISQCIDSFLS